MTLPVGAALRRSQRSGGSECTLLRGILGVLCRRKGTPVYCEHEARYTQYMALRPG